MFGRRNTSTTLGRALSILQVTYHATVRSAQSADGNAVIALALSIGKTLVMVAAFYFMFAVLGMRSAAVRGDFILYLLTGVFLYRMHVQTVVSIMNSAPATSAMMNHAPMNTAITLMSAAFSALYIKTLTVAIILLVYHCAVTPVVIDDPAGAFLCFIMAWAFGFVVGVLFYSLKPWAPGVVQMLYMFYRRATIITSGKMFLANTLPGFMLAMFDWNPLFHQIDQARGFTFINYNPHFSSLAYANYVVLVLLVLGLMMEFYTRRQSSLSWDAKR